MTVGLLRIMRARSAYLRVLRVSSKLTSAGDTHASMTVRELPPRLSWRSRVSRDSR